MTQYKIPQKAQREDRILGPLTMKQLLYAFVSIIILFFTWTILGAPPISLIIYFNSIEKGLIIFPIFVLSVAFTMVEINERPFEKYFFSFIHFLFTPRIFIWQKEEPTVTASDLEIIQSPQTKNTVTESQVPGVSPNLEKLSMMLDNPETNIENKTKRPSMRTLDILETLENQKSDKEKENVQILAKKKTSGLLNFIYMLFGNSSKPKQQKKKKQKKARKKVNTNQEKNDIIDKIGANQSQDTAQNPSSPQEKPPLSQEDEKQRRIRELLEKK